MNDNLDAFSDNLLNTAFAVEVASMEQRRGLIWWAYKGSSDCGALPQFCTDANAVLPWLDKSGWHAAHNVVAGALPYSVPNAPLRNHPLQPRHDGRAFVERVLLRVGEVAPLVFDVRLAVTLLLPRVSPRNPLQSADLMVVQK